jgi:SAM-dependent methyltransferase
VSATEFWTENQVGGPYSSVSKSERDLIRRERLFPRLYELMPVSFPDKIVLDYGCGPGHDTVLFCQNGAGHVFYYDVSPLALEIVDERLEMHGLAERASPVSRGSIPKVDHAHCAGVLHHAEDPHAILRDIRYALKPEGDLNVMIYDGERSKHTTSKVPITTWWTENEFKYLAHMAGFRAEYLDSYECSSPWRPECWAACYRLTYRA